MRRGSKAGPSATQMLRFPSSSSVHAKRFTFLAAVRFSANGALRTCSSVNGFCAAAWRGTNNTASTSKVLLFIYVSPTCSTGLVCRLSLSRTLYRHAWNVQRPRNFQDVTGFQGTALAPTIRGGLNGQVGVPPEAYRAFDEGEFAPGLEAQACQNDATVAQGEGTCSRGPT